MRPVPHGASEVRAALAKVPELLPAREPDRWTSVVMGSVRAAARAFERRPQDSAYWWEWPDHYGEVADALVSGVRFLERAPRKEPPSHRPGTPRAGR